MRSVNSNGTLNPYVLYPSEVKPKDRVGYKVIAIHHGVTWAAYRGLTDWSDDKVQNEGDKLDEKVARLLFPVMDNLGVPYND